MFTQFAKDLFRYSDKMEKSSVSEISSPRSKEAQQKLLELTKHGLLKVGDKVQFYYKAKEYIARVTSEGCLLHRGENGESELFLSPSAFVNTVAKRQSASSRGKTKPKLNLNGWEFCLVAGVSLSQLKQQLEAILQAEGGGTGSSSMKTNIKVPGKQETVAEKRDSLLTEQQQLSDSEEPSTPLKKKQRTNNNEDPWIVGEENVDQSQKHSADVSHVEEAIEQQPQEEVEKEQIKQEEDSQPSESENEDHKSLKKRTTRLSSGSIKHISYTKGTKQTSNDEGSSLDPDKTDDDRELNKMDNIEGASIRGRRRRLSATTRNSSRLASQATKSSRGKQEVSSDEEEEERTVSRVSGRHLRRDKTRESSPKVVSTQEDDQQSHSDDNGEAKQENDELNSQMTGEEDAYDLEESSALILLEQIKEAERMELHCGWSKEDRESLLGALKDTKQLDPTVLSQHMMESKSSEEITEYLKVLKDRMIEATKDSGLEPDVSLYIILLSLELFHTGVVASGGAFSKKLEHTWKASVPIDSQAPHTCKKATPDTDRNLKKIRKELEELRNKVEMEMAARRDLELEKQLLEVQLQEAKRATEREARKRAAIEDENEDLKVRELETRRRLDRLKLKLTAVKGEVNTTEKDNGFVVSSNIATHSVDNHTKVFSGETTEEKDSVHEDHAEIALPPIVKDHSQEEELEKLQEEVDLLRSKVASLETEVSDFQQDAENERRRNHHLMEAKKYLEISLNEVLHASSKSSSPDEMEATSNEQSVSELEAKSSFHSKDMNERVLPSFHRITSSIIARRRKSRSFRSMLV
ncbi:hypothetical protein GpartN1_g22.t1 [Galdieria partita]|uniref:Uncharacterized protein n=1 Tax=Galdieria partita TaxID=83374 RepID=A0A9C7UMG2_9RHOD|nr:hypothetical protein GpartN1_g22.t1 [Galdieria partita]